MLLNFFQIGTHHTEIGPINYFAHSTDFKDGI